MLEGFEKSWNYVGHQRNATYTNLSAGKYIFKVKASNNDGIWNDTPTSLSLQILPPWWKTRWFTLTWVLLMVISVIIIIKIRTYSLAKQKKRLEEIVEQRTFELKEMNIVLEEGKEELEQQMVKLAHMNKEIERMAIKVHEADQSKLRFFANISHEFRTPLTLIIGPLEKCIQIQESVHWNRINIKNYLHLMYRNASRLIRLVNQIIDLRKLEQGRQKINISNNQIISFIKEVVDAFSIIANKKGLHISLNIDHSSLINEDQMIIKKGYLNNDKLSMINDFWFDPDIMEKILYNLISNAIKYTPEGGEILISIGIIETRLIESQQNQLEIKIADNGIGIKPENQEKIFNRFYRVSDTGKNNKEGTGIGLAYTRELVMIHKGIITVESQFGKGTTFTLCFPIEDLSKLSKKEATYIETKETYNENFKLEYIISMLEEDRKSVSYENEYYNTAKKQILSELKSPLIESKGQIEKSGLEILIVEDNLEFRDFLKGELEINYRIIEAENGKEGWEAALEKLPDLIISDIMMPLMDGIELCEKIKTDENTCHIPVILLTAKTGEESMLEGLETGADDYITKPFKIDILKIKIANIFKLRKNMHEKFNSSYDIGPSDIAISKLDEKFLQKAIKIVNDNLLTPNFDNNAFIESMHYGKSQVYKKIKILTGQSVSEFIRNIRLKAAAKKFLEGYDKISDVSQMVGFKNQNDLYRYFPKMFGKSPSQFIKDNLPNLSKR